jgi:hypothetical protein
VNIDKEARKLVLIYEAAAGKLMTDLLSLDVVNFTAAGAMRVREKVDAIIRKLNRSSARWLGRTIRSAYGEERRITENRLLMMGAERNRKRSKIHAKAIKRLTDRVGKDLVKANESIRTIAGQYVDLIRQGASGAKELQAFSKLTVKERARISDLVDNAVRLGESRGKLQRNIMDYLKDRLDEDKFITIGGRNYNIKKYIELVSKTSLREAASEAVVSEAKEYDHDLVEVPAKLNSCEEICVPLEGQVYSISGETRGYPILDQRPPFHPRCKHYLRVVSEVMLARKEQEEKKWLMETQ